MDKAEYRIKLEQINSLAEAGDFKGAAAVVDTIDWRHVKSVRTLCMVGEIYEANKRYEDSKRVLQYAYKRSSISKTVLYRLAEINIRTGDYDDAKRFYNEFEQLSPHDTSRYILKYKLLRAEEATLDDQIAVLKEYKEREYTERWAYELAKLYMKNGQKQKCIDECDEMILWFAEGKYVTRAKELKMKLRAPSDPQKKTYSERYQAETETGQEARQQAFMTDKERISRAAAFAADEEELPAAGKKEKKFSAVDIIQKMDAAADETVSSALGEERTGTVAAMAQVAQKAAATQEAIEAAAKATASSPKAVFETFEESVEQADTIAERVAEPANAVRKEADAAAHEVPAKTAEEAVKEENVAGEAPAEAVAEAAEEMSAVAEGTDTAVEEAEVAEEVNVIAEEPDTAAEEAEAAEEVNVIAEEPDTAAEEAEAAEEVNVIAEEPDTAVEAAAVEAAEEISVAAKVSADQADLIAEQASADLAEESAWKAAAIEAAAAETARMSVAMKAAEEKAAEESAAARAKAAALADQFREQASAEAAEEAAWRAAAAEGAAVTEGAETAAAETAAATEGAETAAAETAAATEGAETASVETAAATEGVATAAAAEGAKAEEAPATEEIAEDISRNTAAVSDEAVELVKEYADQANDEAAEAAAWKAAAEANAAGKSTQKSATREAEEAAMDVAAEEAAWIAAVKAAAESVGQRAAEPVNEVSGDAAVSEIAAAQELAAEDADETEDAAEEPAPISPEELARSADEEAERALQEMMASFLNEFAVSGDEYKMTTDIIPDEEDIPEKAPAPQPRYDENDPERMLGKETDESLGLTRTESFQEQLKKALEEGGNYEEASQIVIPDDLESPEDAAKRTVMTAHGLEYDPDENAEEADAEGDDRADAESADDENADAETADEDSADTEADDENADSKAAGEENADTEAADEDMDSETDEDGSAETDGDVTEEGEEPSADEEGQESGEETAQESEEEPEPVKPAPEIMERVAVLPRKFTEEERELFSYFADIPGISEQASLALADIHNNAGDKTSRSGNVLIMGRQLSGKTRLADALICAACMDLNIAAAKVAKVIGEDLNEKDPAEVVDRMSGGFLLIEGAGSMSDEFVEGLNKAMEFRTDDLVVILEDEKGDMMDMLGKHEQFARKFTSRIIIPVLTNDELVTFARTYANEKGYKLDEMGTLALYTMIGENQTDTEPVVIGQVKKMVDRAIERSKGPKIAALFRKNAPTEDGRTWLREKDFRF